MGGAISASVPPLRVQLGTCKKCLAYKASLLEIHYHVIHACMVAFPGKGPASPELKFGHPLCPCACITRKQQAWHCCLGQKGARPRGLCVGRVCAALQGPRTKRDLQEKWAK